MEGFTPGTLPAAVAWRDGDLADPNEIRLRSPIMGAIRHPLDSLAWDMARGRSRGVSHVRGVAAIPIAPGLDGYRAGEGRWCVCAPLACLASVARLSRAAMETGVSAPCLAEAMADTCGSTAGLSISGDMDMQTQDNGWSRCPPDTAFSEDPETGRTSERVLGMNGIAFAMMSRAGAADGRGLCAERCSGKDLCRDNIDGLIAGRGKAGDENPAKRQYKI